MQLDALEDAQEKSQFCTLCNAGGKSRIILYIHCQDGMKHEAVHTKKTDTNRKSITVPGDGAAGASRSGIVHFGGLNKYDS